MWNLVGCIDGSGYCCSETWHTLEDGSKDRYLSQVVEGSDEPIDFTQTNTFYGVPKYLQDQLKEGNISHDDYFLLQSYYDGLKVCREYERSN